MEADGMKLGEIKYQLTRCAELGVWEIERTGINETHIHFDVIPLKFYGNETVDNFDQALLIAALKQFAWNKKQLRLSVTYDYLGTFSAWFVPDKVKHNADEFMASLDAFLSLDWSKDGAA